MFALWPGDWLNFSTFKPATFGYGGQTAASETGHIANTNVASNCMHSVNRATKIFIDALTNNCIRLFKIYVHKPNLYNYEKFYQTNLDFNLASFYSHVAKRIQQYRNQLP